MGGMKGEACWMTAVDLVCTGPGRADGGCKHQPACGARDDERRDER